MRGVDIYKPMKERGLLFALFDEKKKCGHKLVTRNNHCIECDVSRIEYQRRDYRTGHVYLAYAHNIRRCKIGCSEFNPYSRINSLNERSYGGTEEWKLVAYAYVEDMGVVERKIQGRLKHKWIRDEYGGNEARELYKCLKSYGLETLKLGLQEIEPNILVMEL
jgi:hypothetical protein